MWVKWVPLFIVGALLETLGQLCFKQAATTHRAASGIAYYLRLAATPAVLGGILAYMAEMILWVYLLAHIPLSIAFPMAGLQQLIILSVSWLWLRERVSRTELLGAASIAAGIFLIARSS